MLRLAELEEEEGAATNGSKGTKAVAGNGEVRSNGNGEALDDEREDGEVDEENDVSLASEGGAAGGASKIGTVPPQLRQAKSIEANTEQRGEGRMPEVDTSADTAKPAAPGQTTTFPLQVEASSCVFSWTHLTLLTLWIGEDQILENIKMAYWWAGYYSGLYEGQQQVKRASTR